MVAMLSGIDHIGEQCRTWHMLEVFIIKNAETHCSGSAG
jgi:hypothetical protein